MQQLLLRIDRFNTLVGHAFAWTVVLLTLVITWEVFSRYVLNSPHAWVFDATYMLYGTLFMMAGAYTLAASGHVRGDVLYGFFRPRTQATLDLILYFVFFIPGVLALCWAGWDFASESWVINEHSSVSADGPPIYPFKAIIPLAGASLMQSVDISTVNFQTFSELAFRFRLTPAIAVQSIAFALLMGLVGGFIPAWRAARMKIVDCLRAA